MKKLLLLSKYIKRLNLTPTTAILYAYVISKIVRIIRYLYSKSQSTFDEFVNEDIISKTLRNSFGIIVPENLRVYFNALTDPFTDMFYTIFGTHQNWKNYLTTSEKLAKLLNWFGPFILAYVILVKGSSTKFKRR